MKFIDQISVNVQIYVKTRKRTTTVQEKGFHYNSEKITMVAVWSHALGLLALIDPSPLIGGVYYLYM